MKVINVSLEAWKKVATLSQTAMGRAEKLLDMCCWGELMSSSYQEGKYFAQFFSNSILYLTALKAIILCR